MNLPKTGADGIRWRIPLFLPVVLFLLLFYFYPLVRITLLSLLPSESGAGSGLEKLFASTTWLRILWFTTWQAGLSTLLTLLVALPGAILFGRFSFRYKSLLESLATIPFILPTVVTAAGFRALLGEHGLVNNLLMDWFNRQTPVIELDQTIWFFLLAHIFYNYSLVLRIVGNFLANLPGELAEASRMLGGSGYQTFVRITLPLLIPAIGSAALLTFIFCFTSFGVILILGGPGYSTLEVEIYRQSVQLFNLPMAACLSLIQIMTNFFLMYLHSRLSRDHAVGFFSGDRSHLLPGLQTWSQRFFAGGNLVVMGLLLLSPMLALLTRSFTDPDGAFTLDYYLALFSRDSRSVFFVEPITAVYNSLGFGVATTICGLGLGIAASLFLAGSGKRASGIWDAIIMLPLATSAVTLGFGYIISLNRPPLNLRDSMVLVVIAHTLVAFPFVVRCILPSLRAIPQSMREAATMLGGSPIRVFQRIDLPLIWKGAVTGAIFAFSISLGEFGASAFVTRPHTPTMPVAIFRLLGQPGEMNYGQAMAMSAILMFVTCSGFLLMARLGKR